MRTEIYYILLLETNGQHDDYYIDKLLKENDLQSWGYVFSVAKNVIFLTGAKCK
jgi:hypothetical protein